MRKQKNLSCNTQEIKFNKCLGKILSESLSEVITLQKLYHMLWLKLLLVWKLMAWEYF